jgi:muramoyltetrapeptide carboxypeptidase
MNYIFPKKLQRGDLIRVIAPSRTMKIISQECRELATEHLESLGLRVSFGTHVEEADRFLSARVAHRVADLHDAFSDPEVKGILTVIGGFNANQLLAELDYDLIKANPKVFCGYSDITVLTSAITAQTGLVTYSGPHYSSFGQQHGWEYTTRAFAECVMEDAPLSIQPAETWSDDSWWLDQLARNFRPNPGWWIIHPGEAKGTIMGGNLNTLNLLQGTPYFPSIKNSILFLEDDELSNAHTFDRDLQSLIQTPEFASVRGIVIGRFQKKSEVDRELLTAILELKPELAYLPIIANVDFGHTDPRITFPIGGEAELMADAQHPSLTITKH